MEAAVDLDDAWLQDTTRKIDRILRGVDEGQVLQLTVVHGSRTDLDPSELGSVMGGGTPERIRSLRAIYASTWKVQCSLSNSFYYLTFSRRRTLWDHLQEVESPV